MFPNHTVCLRMSSQRLGRLDYIRQVRRERNRLDLHTYTCTPKYRPCHVHVHVQCTSVFLFSERLFSHHVTVHVYFSVPMTV